MENLIGIGKMNHKKISDFFRDYDFVVYTLYSQPLIICMSWNERIDSQAQGPVSHVGMEMKIVSQYLLLELAN